MGAGLVSALSGGVGLVPPAGERNGGVLQTGDQFLTQSVVDDFLDQSFLIAV